MMANGTFMLKINNLLSIIPKCSGKVPTCICMCTRVYVCMCPCESANMCAHV